MIISNTSKLWIFSTIVICERMKIATYRKGKIYAKQISLKGLTLRFIKISITQLEREKTKQKKGKN